MSETCISLHRPDECRMDKHILDGYELRFSISCIAFTLKIFNWIANLIAGRFNLFREILAEFLINKTEGEVEPVYERSPASS